MEDRRQITLILLWAVGVQGEEAEGGKTFITISTSLTIILLLKFFYLLDSNWYFTFEICVFVP